MKKSCQHYSMGHRLDVKLAIECLGMTTHLFNTDKVSTKLGRELAPVFAEIYVTGHFVFVQKPVNTDDHPAAAIGVPSTHAQLYAGTH